MPKSLVRNVITFARDVSVADAKKKTKKGEVFGYPHRDTPIDFADTKTGVKLQLRGWKNKINKQGGKVDHVPALLPPGEIFAIERRKKSVGGRPFGGLKWRSEFESDEGDNIFRVDQAGDIRKIRNTTIERVDHLRAFARRIKPGQGVVVDLHAEPVDRSNFGSQFGGGRLADDMFIRTIRKQDLE